MASEKQDAELDAYVAQVRTYCILNHIPGSNLTVPSMLHNVCNQRIE